MGLFDRPADDRFAPPPGSSDPTPDPTGPRASRVIGLGTLLVGGRYLLHWYSGSSPSRWWLGGGLFVIAIAEYLFGLKRASDRDNSPYSSDQHITH